MIEAVLLYAAAAVIILKAAQLKSLRVGDFELAFG
jgi:hypothetical protein